MKPTVLDTLSDLTRTVALRRANLAHGLREMQARAGRVAEAMEADGISDPEQAVSALAGDMATLAREGAAIYATERMLNTIKRAANK